MTFRIYPPSFRSICIVFSCLYLFFTCYFLYSNGAVNHDHVIVTAQKRTQDLEVSGIIMKGRETTLVNPSEQVLLRSVKNAKSDNEVTFMKKKRPLICHGCFQHNFKYIIDNSHICSKSKSKKIKLLVLIFSTHKNRELRDTVRNTWMSTANNNTSPHVRYVFLLGETQDKMLSRAIIAENEIYGDIIKEDFVDAYKNLTFKTVMAMKWTTTKCMNAEFVMKTDDDMYVNITSVLQSIEQNKRVLQKSIGGNCKPRAWPQRDPDSKWYASKEMYPLSIYPGYCSGSGYVTSMNVIKKIYAISANIPYFHLEDIYVAFCVKQLKYSVKKFPGYYGRLIEFDSCKYKNTPIVTSHAEKAEIIRKMWETPCIEKNTNS